MTPSSSASQLPSGTENDKNDATAPNSTGKTNSTQDGDPQAKAEVSKSDKESSTVQTSNSHAVGPEGPTDGTSMFKKMTKSLGTAKATFVKFAKNE